MQIKRIEGNFSVCRLESLNGVDLSQEFMFVGRTDEELSLVCRTEHVPGQTLEREDGWRAFRIQGVLDFSLIGILARISGILAKEKIGLFALSTYNTDYILVKQENYEPALRALEKEGYEIL